MISIGYPEILIMRGMKLTKNLILEGIFSVETPDTAGEVLSVEGADISDLQTGKATLNTEHINPEDADKEEVHKRDGKDEDDFKGFNTIVGRVVNAKKIFTQDDCESDRELDAWREFKRPMIYGSVEIWDGPEAHDNARAAATVARMFNKHQEGPQLGLSVEGATLERQGNFLKKTVIRKMALTMKPANKAATVDIVADTSAPQVSKSMSKATYDGGQEPLRKSVSMQHMATVIPNHFNDFGLSSALSNLRKALEAGSPAGAPSSLSGGSALQKESLGKKMSRSSQLDKLITLCGKKSPSPALIKTLVPGATDDQAAKIELAIKKRMHESNVDLAKRLFDEMNGKPKN